ncbi:MAG: rhodanese-like domain-containing protein [Moraxellaceae bacterium]|nr:rhodanese-like domain-containing protein [Pseudomonadales bacterium]MCP5175639.1 rhodanese-like domain-containing protein [Moraxellaceae bacterium]MCP5177761.1 rhodanese-like domain-containing protein [Moraxellaceae bacterium]HQV23238.1 rhodanese-like domain-containing protein [Agitococcus sp.]
MQRFVEFIVNNYVLASAFVGLLIAFFIVESKRGGQNISPQSLSNLINKQKALVIDLRDPTEFKKGHITGSHNIPYAKLNDKNNHFPKDRPIVFVCNLGQVAGTAAKTLKTEHGINDVFKLEGGISNWKALSLPLVK